MVNVTDIRQLSVTQDTMVFLEYVLSTPVWWQFSILRLGEFGF